MKSYKLNPMGRKVDYKYAAMPKQTSDMGTLPVVVDVSEYERMGKQDVTFEFNIHGAEHWYVIYPDLGEGKEGMWQFQENLDEDGEIRDICYGSWRKVFNAIKREVKSFSEFSEFSGKEKAA